jgi:hypothetical protein
VFMLILASLKSGYNVQSPAGKAMTSSKLS